MVSDLIPCANLHLTATQALALAAEPGCWPALRHETRLNLGSAGDLSHVTLLRLCRDTCGWINPSSLVFSAMRICPE